MAGPVHVRRLSAGVVVVNLSGAAVQYLLLRAYKNWDFPKGLVEAGEQPLDAAVREVKEETTLENLAFDWGKDYIDTGPYNKGKISRYYIARSDNTLVSLPINPELGFPEHQESRWVTFDTALSMVSPRLKPVMHWARGIIGASLAGASAGEATGAEVKIQAGPKTQASAAATATTQAAAESDIKA